MDEQVSLHQTDGTLEVEGPDAPIRIIWDRWGVPHAQTASARDAFFAQGYCMGQERGWQIELYRHMAHGRAASLLNKGLLRIDRMNRTLGFGRDAALEWEDQSDDARLILQAYADGINAAIAVGPAPVEFALLEHEMQPWSPVDSLAILKMVSANLQWSTKIGNAEVAARLGIDALQALIPDVPADGALIAPAGSSWANGRHAFADALADLEAEPGTRRGSLDGSNCWVIDGEHTASGKPLVVGDPHLAFSVPPQWYLMHMQCPEFLVAGPCNPGYPGPVYYGHNTQIAWTMTHAQGDRWDVYRERIERNGTGPGAKWLDGVEPLQRRDEVIEIRGEEPVTQIVWSTRHGPVVQGDPETDDEVLTAKFGLSDPCHDFDGMLPIFTSDNIHDARTGFQRYDSISGNYCFADQRGNIGYQYTGRVPVRDAKLTPVSGWDGEHEWQGDVPADELPQDLNPDRGVIITANNRTTTPDYPYYLTFSQTPYRADRLRELLQGRDDWSPNDMPQIQSDQTSIHARFIAQRVSSADVDGEAADLKSMLANWDGHLAIDSTAGLLYQELCQQIIGRTVRPYFDAPARLPEGSADELRILHEQLRTDSSLMLSEGVSWDNVIGESLVAAGETLAERYGADRAKWRYGDAHSVTWRHNLGRDPERAARFNVGDFAKGGDGNTPNNATGLVHQPADHGVSYRQIFDLSSLNGARIVLPPGNSGRPDSPHYSDHMEKWLNMEYFPLYIEWDDIEANSEGSLTLTPAL
ncbi:MAG: penicillin acylase family protein [Chloroflexi bacterium]|nr:penicillin acylase family protein [Chloroflexota bacterium]